MEWSIQARSHQCQACGRGFRNKETLHTLLRDERNAYVRMDVCAACWSAHYAEGANHQRGFVSCWQSHYSPPAPPPPEPIRKETAETLLRKLVERQAPEHAAACFILAVMLERKRLLKVKGQTTDGGQRVLIYEHPKSGDVFTILDPQLQLDQLEAVQRDVARLLEHGLDAPPASADGAPSNDPGAAAAPGEVVTAGETQDRGAAGGAADRGTDTEASGSVGEGAASVAGEAGEAVLPRPVLNPQGEADTASAPASGG